MHTRRSWRNSIFYQEEPLFPGMELESGNSDGTSSVFCGSGPGLITGRLCHSLWLHGRSARQKDLHSFIFKILDNGTWSWWFFRTRSTCDLQGDRCLQPSKLPFPVIHPDGSEAFSVFLPDLPVDLHATFGVSPPTDILNRNATCGPYLTPDIMSGRNKMSSGGSLLGLFFLYAPFDLMSINIFLIADNRTSGSNTPGRNNLLCGRYVVAIGWCLKKNIKDPGASTGVVRNR